MPGETFNAELLLLRDQRSRTFGLFSPLYNSVLIPPNIATGRQGKLLATLFHEKTHWAQFNLSPWGQFAFALYELFVDLSEEILVHTRVKYGRIDKPLFLFLDAGSRRKDDRLLDDLCNHHIDALDALPLLFRGAGGLPTQVLDDALSAVNYMVTVRAQGHDPQELTLMRRPRTTCSVESSGAPPWRALVETWARVVERLAVIRYGLERSRASDVEFDRIMPGDYGALFPRFLALSGLPSYRVNEVQAYSMLAACAVAMQSPVHAAFGAHASATEEWADALPEMRFLQAAQAIREIGPVGTLVPNAPRQHELEVARLMDRICTQLGWPTAGELAGEFARRCDEEAIYPGRFTTSYRTAVPLIRKDPSLLAFGPCHSDWVEFERRIGGVPVFVDPLLSKRIPGPTEAAHIAREAYEQIRTGVKFHLYNEILFEDSHFVQKFDAFKDAEWVDDREARAVADRMFLRPVLEGLERRGVLVGDISEWNLYTFTPDETQHVILVKSKTGRTDLGEAFERKGSSWKLAINGRQISP